MNNPFIRGCAVLIAGLVLIVLGFLIASLGIHAVILDNSFAFYLALAGLIIILLASFLFLWIINQHHPNPGGPATVPPPPRDVEFFEKENL
jgi:hypothetical protein